MKKLYFLALLLPLSMGANARQLSPAEALSRVNDFKVLKARNLNSEKDISPVLTVTAGDDFNGVYVFKNEGDGFLIVSADDCAVPLLGYSDSEDFAVEGMPSQLAGWLDFYAKEIKWSATHDAPNFQDSKRKVSNGMAVIQPLTKSKWNQSAPYNDDCPLDNGKRSVTGCIATAMAQAMYYHQWPKTGTGEHSYKWNGTTLSVDFGETTYDWDNMTDTYDDSSTVAAKAAVANLMYSCGVSVDMNYSSDESGASSESMLDALYKYFGYDISMAMPQRSYYGNDEWEKMVYDQLSQGLPVLYDGQSYEGGHQFVCDGYDGNGYFHFNWGWGGMSDGYFLLSALNPLNQGIGGSASDSGFNYDQSIVINMKPAQSDSSVTPLIYCWGSFKTKSSDNVKLGEKATFEGPFFNFACTDIEVEVGVKLVAADGSVYYLKRDGYLGFGSNSGYENITVTLPESLADGSYTVTPAFLPKGSSEWVDILCPLSGVQALTMTVSDSEASFANDVQNKVEVTDFKFDTPLYFDENFSASFTITNTGTSEYFGEYVLYLYDTDGKLVEASSDIDSIDLLPGESQEITYISKFASEIKTDEGTEKIPAGYYKVALIAHFSKEVIYSYPETVRLQEAPAETSISILSFGLQNGGNKVEDPADVTFAGTLMCGEGYFTGRIEVAVFKKGTESTDITGKSAVLFVPAGETADFTAKVDIYNAKPGDEYFALVFCDGKQASDTRCDFTIAKSDGVDTVNDAFVSAYIYSIDGLFIQTLHDVTREGISDALQNHSPGIYIVMLKNSAGNIETLHVLR